MEAASAAGDPGIHRPVSRGHFPGDGGMWFFVIGDLVIFAVYFVFYMVYRGLNEELFLQSQQQLNQGLAIVNTVVLLTSSLFVALGTEAARDGKRVHGVRLIGIAVILGSVFPVLKLLEWLPKLSAGFTAGENLFFMYYYVLTGLHLCHVLLGLVILGFILRHLKVSNDPDIKFIESGAIYWHMVDLLWLVLIALFYLMR